MDGTSSKSLTTGMFMGRFSTNSIAWFSSIISKEVVEEVDLPLLESKSLLFEILFSLMASCIVESTDKFSISLVVSILLELSIVFCDSLATKFELSIFLELFSSGLLSRSLVFSFVINSFVLFKIAFADVDSSVLIST